MTSHSIILSQVIYAFNHCTMHLRERSSRRCSSDVVDLTRHLRHSYRSFSQAVKPILKRMYIHVWYVCIWIIEKALNSCRGTTRALDRTGVHSLTHLRYSLLYSKKGYSLFKLLWKRGPEDTSVEGKGDHEIPLVNSKTCASTTTRVLPKIYIHTYVYT